ncbi:MAG: hypothetical protein AAF604_10225 [Acidobacteriota bacterium]
MEFGARVRVLALAQSLITTLQGDSPGALLDLGDEDPRSLYRQLLVYDEPDRDDRPLFIAAETYEAEGRPAAAAVLFALEHDRRLNAEGPLERTARAALRFRLAAALWRDGGRLFIQQAIPVLEGILQHLDDDSPANLRFHVLEHLGYNRAALGQSREAAEAFLRAERWAPNGDTRGAVIVLAAEALDHGVGQHAAEHLLRSRWQVLKDVQDVQVLGRWLPFLSIQSDAEEE